MDDTLSNSSLLGINNMTRYVTLSEEDENCKTILYREPEEIFTRDLYNTYLARYKRYLVKESYYVTGIKNLWKRVCRKLRETSC